MSGVCKGPRAGVWCLDSDRTQPERGVGGRRAPAGSGRGVGLELLQFWDSFQGFKRGNDLKSFDEDLAAGTVGNVMGGQE